MALQGEGDGPLVIRGNLRDCGTSIRVAGVVVK
jgi:hypothetical protein